MFLTRLGDDFWAAQALSWLCPSHGWSWKVVVAFMFLSTSTVLLTNVLDEFLLSIGAKACLCSGTELNMIYWCSKKKKKNLRLAQCSSLREIRIWVCQAVSLGGKFCFFTRQNMVMFCIPWQLKPRSKPKETERSLSILLWANFSFSSIKGLRSFLK